MNVSYEMFKIIKTNLLIDSSNRTRVSSSKFSKLFTDLKLRKSMNSTVKQDSKNKLLFKSHEEENSVYHNILTKLALLY